MKNPSIIKYNYINGTYLAVVIKTAGVDYGCIVQYNIIENCDSAFTIKGSPNTSILNNTVINNSATAQGNFVQSLLDPNFAGSNSVDCVYKNNIIALYDVTNYGAFITATTADLVGNDWDNNMYYYNGMLSHFAIVNTPTALTFTEWQALGFDTNSNLDDPELLGFIPQAESPAIGAGINLGSSYATGIDSSTNWGNETQLPNVVTAQQVDTWNIGAYVND